MLKRLSAVSTAILLLASLPLALRAAAQSSTEEAAGAQAKSAGASTGSCGGNLSAPLPSAPLPSAQQTSAQQTADASGRSEGGSGGASGGGSASAAAAAAAGNEALSPAEQQVKKVISQEGVHVVRFWAPWCPNSTGEMGKGWSRLVKRNEDVTFTFVTVWNKGQGGAGVLDKYDIPERVTELTPQPPEEGRLSTFLGRPIYWIPSTWIFHNKGERAFAMNYGEMDMSTIQTLIDATQADW